MWKKCDRNAEFIITNYDDYALSLCKLHFIQTVSMLVNLSSKFNVAVIVSGEGKHNQCDCKEIDGNNDQ